MDARINPRTVRLSGDDGVGTSIETCHATQDTPCPDLYGAFGVKGRCDDDGVGMMARGEPATGAVDRATNLYSVDPGGSPAMTVWRTVHPEKFSRPAEF